MHPTATQDEQQIADLLRTFYAAFTSGPEMLDPLQGLWAHCLLSAVIVKTCGVERTADDVEAAAAPRRGLLTSGVVQDFREWELKRQTQVLGDVAQHFSSYAKSWVEDGMPATGRGMKAVQLVRAERGWRISALAWDDQRDGVPLGPS